jgi:ABC-type glycerol-3-phosphate transport system substrate-binding protein
MNRPTKIFALLLVLATGLALAACGSSDDGDSTAATPPPPATDAAEETTAEKPAATIIVRDGEPVGGVRELEYGAGDQIEFTVRSDVADEIHVHGYDLSKDVKAGGSVSFSFPAEIEGIFEVELEERGVQIAELRVNP